MSFCAFPYRKYWLQYQRRLPLRIPAEVVKYALGATETQPEKGDMRAVSEDWGDMDGLTSKCISGFIRWLIKAVFRFM